MTRDELRAEALRRGIAQRAAQGLPPMITDPVILRAASDALASATPDRSSAVRRGAVERPGIGGAGSTRSSNSPSGKSGQRTAAARAGQPSGFHAPAPSKTKKKAGVAATTPARDASTPAEGVQEPA